MLRDVTQELIESSIVGFDPIDWWMFRYWRLAALRYVFLSLEKAKPELRAMGPVLGLGAISVWIKNSLIFRPGEQRWDKAIVPPAAYWDAEDEENLAEDDEVQNLVAEGQMGPAIEERGLYFVSAVEYDYGIYSLPPARGLDARTYAMIYNCNSFTELELLFMASAVKKARKEPTALPRCTKLRRRIPPRARSPDRDIDFGLGEAGVRVRRLPGVVGAVDVLDGGLDGEVNAIWQDFLRDIAAVIPCFAKGGCYSTLTIDE
ncbi:uncharacterized protein PHACADRAFT_203310 [Phanerochaete carnosa HHB-10118-sp]|uniref:Uncharacterized protein n=1 Tax=Phanerochaete carnosa (strain HHB-10118-sp) TaxID=650164 RepID=K5VAE1_PHACS|nr:uncharacterized protein PHACADRAFT_203310 [Phanerochaete carnosa HHB-10118-sp]EKM48058.1 hypothetical protein PHACADRAFT_203310 [Phanerochaete carnosa HHB-10118-sp]